MANQRLLQGVKGMPDVMPGESRRWRAVERAAESVFGLAGFSQIRTPIVEPQEVFVRSVGGASDIVRKEMYTLTDLGGRLLALRPEGTAGVVRALLEHGAARPDEEVRVWYGGPMFRYEQPQKGRQRQFHQIGVEVFGNASPWLDAELIALGVRLLEAVGAPIAAVRINSIGGEGSRAAFRAALLAFAEPHRGELCEDCRGRLATNPLRVLDCKNPRCREVYAAAPRPRDFLAGDEREHFAVVCRGLEAQGIGYVEDGSLVRGLDYYTQTVFEITSPVLGAQDTVLAGGRYDGLVQGLGGPAIPAFGFAAGLERLLLAAQLPEAPSDPVCIGWIALDEAARGEGATMVDRLRRDGVAARHFPQKTSLKSQLRAADAAGVTHAALRGEREREEGVVTLKRMADGRQVSVACNAQTVIAAARRDDG